METANGKLIWIAIFALLSIASLICAIWNPWQLLTATINIIMLVVFINEFYKLKKRN